MTDLEKKPNQPVGVKVDPVQNVSSTERVIPTSSESGSSQSGVPPGADVPGAPGLPGDVSTGNNMDTSMKRINPDSEEFERTEIDGYKC